MSAYMLDGIAVTPSVLYSSSIPLPDTSLGEVVWVSGSAYAIDAEVMDPDDLNIYSCVQAHSGRSTKPHLDGKYWLFKQAANRMRMFDDKVMTDSTATTSITVVLRPGFCNAVQAYGLTGAQARMVYEDQPGGSVKVDTTISLQEPPTDWYDWAFGQIRPLEMALFKDLVPYPNAQVTLTVSAAAGNPVGVGKLLVGDLIPLDDPDEIGGVADGASAEPVSHAYVDTDKWGNTTIQDGPASTDLRFKLQVPRARADYILQVTRRRLAKPTSWILSDQPGFQGLSTYGLGACSATYSNQRAEISGYVKGMI